MIRFVCESLSVRYELTSSPPKKTISGWDGALSDQKKGVEKKKFVGRKFTSEKRMNKPSSHSQRKREEGGGGLREKKKFARAP